MRWSAARHHLSPGAGVVVTTTFASALALAGCATAPAASPSRGAKPDASLQLGEAVAQPFQDLNLGRADAPAVLRLADAATFHEPAACAAADAEIQALDAALRPGPHAGPRLDPSALATSAVRSVWRLPFRGVVRQLSGAERRDRAQATAIRSGLLRRGFLEGWRTGRCAPSQAERTQAVAEAIAPSPS